AASSAAILGIIGFLDIPLIHMSVYWWRTLHQPPSILRPDKAPWENIQWPLLTPLLINVVAFFLFYFYLLSLRFRLGEITEEIKTRRMNRVDCWVDGDLFFWLVESSGERCCCISFRSIDAFE